LKREQATPPIALETKNLSRSVADKILVDDISVQVQEGEALAVVGPTGAGKSSFLRLLNRLDEPTGGSMLLDGQDYRTIASQELRRRVEMVMQMAYLFPGTVAANIAFGPLQRHETLSPDKIRALLDLIGLPGYQDREVSTLSGGEAQRVSLARTLANSPECCCWTNPPPPWTKHPRGHRRACAEYHPRATDDMYDSHPRQTTGSPHGRPDDVPESWQAGRDCCKQ
jgi:putative ABC transport system ATP-binding protein